MYRSNSSPTVAQLCCVTKRREKTPPKPLDSASLRELAFGYVARFATTRARLGSYLGRKLRERGWNDTEPADPAALVAYMADRGYIDDAGYATMKAGSLLRRGYGRRRVANMYYADGIEEGDRRGAEDLCEAERISAIVALARRRHFGPFAEVAPDDALRQRQLATLIRAGHEFGLAKRLLDLGREGDETRIVERLAEG
jgi:regulatory protein